MTIEKAYPGFLTVGEDLERWGWISGLTKASGAGWSGFRGVASWA
jgi:hypothetical protein